MSRALLSSVRVVLAVVFVSGHGASSNGFMGDDLRFVVDNPFVRGEGAWWTAFTDPTTVDPVNESGIVRPLRTLEFRLDQALGGGAALFHWHSVFAHAVASVLVLGVLRRLLCHAGAALLAALVWALHPMHTESVASISSRADVAMGACVAGALYCALRSTGRDRWLVAGLVSGALAMMWKETAVVLPMLVVTVCWLRAPADGRAPWRGVAWWIGLAVAYVVFRFTVGSGVSSHVEYRIGGGVVGTLATMLRALGAYALFAVVPVRPGNDWYLPASRTLADPSALAWLAVHVAVALGAVRAALRGRRLLLCALALFVVPLLPVANWPFDLGIPTTERFLYVPLLGLALLVGAAAREVPRVRTVVLVIATALAALSIARVPEWRDDDTLLAASLRSHDSVRAHAHFGAVANAEGWELRRAGDEAGATARFEAALSHLTRAVDGWRAQIEPWPPSDHIVAVPLINAANAAYALGRYDEALGHADLAVRISPRLSRGHYNVALARLALGDPSGAVDAMDAALARGQPVDGSEALRFFATAGDALGASGDVDAARAAYRRALTFGSDEDVADALRALDD